MVADNCSTYSCGLCGVSPSGSVSFAKMSAARRQMSINSRVEKAASAARDSACRSRSRRISPALAWLISTNGSPCGCQACATLDTAVWFAATEDRDMQHQYTPSTTLLE